jgi:hypothetical protein
LERHGEISKEDDGAIDGKGTRVRASDDVSAIDAGGGHFRRRRSNTPSTCRHISNALRAPSTGTSTASVHARIDDLATDIAVEGEEKEKMRSR